MNNTAQSPLNSPSGIDRLAQNRIQRDPVSNLTVKNGFNSKPKKTGCKKRFVTCFVVLFIGVLLLTGTTVAAAYYATNNYVPVLSPLVEDLLVSDAQQFAKKTEDIVEDIAVRSIKESKDSGFEVDTDYSDDEINAILESSPLNVDTYTFDSVTKVRLESDSSVLGEFTEAGSLDEEGLQKILEANEADISLSSKGMYDGSQESNQKFQANNILTFASEGITLSTDFDLYLEKNIGYFRLNAFPANPWIITESIDNEWLSYETDTQDLAGSISSGGLLDVYGLGVPGSFNLSKQGTESMKNFLRTDTMKENVERLDDEKFDNIATKCYRVNLDKGELKKLSDEFNQEYAGTGQTVDIDDSIEAMLFESCFAVEDNFPHRIKYQIEGSYSDLKYNVSEELKLTGLNLDYDLKKPDESKDMNDVDWSNVFPLLYDQDSEVVSVAITNTISDLQVQLENIQATYFTEDGFNTDQTRVSFKADIDAYTKDVEALEETLSTTTFTENEALFEESANDILAQAQQISSLLQDVLALEKQGRDSTTRIGTIEEMIVSFIESVKQLKEGSNEVGIGT